jgi:hypothetical protein
MCFQRGNRQCGKFGIFASAEGDCALRRGYTPDMTANINKVPVCAGSRTRKMNEMRGRIFSTGILVAAGVWVLSFASANPVQAQASGCEKAQTFSTERQGIVARLNASSKSKRKMTPQEACGILGKLVSNGNSFIAWANTNKDWCQIPNQFVEGLTADNANANKIRGQACNAVKQQAVMIQRARAAQARQAQQKQGGAGSFGGSDSVTGGPVRVPPGAL